VGIKISDDTRQIHVGYMGGIWGIYSIYCKKAINLNYIGAGVLAYEPYICINIGNITYIDINIGN